MIVFANQNRKGTVKVVQAQVQALWVQEKSRRGKCPRKESRYQLEEQRKGEREKGRGGEIGQLSSSPLHIPYYLHFPNEHGLFHNKIYLF